jgi:hypothetical protein
MKFIGVSLELLPGALAVVAGGIVLFVFYLARRN